MAFVFCTPVWQRPSESIRDTLYSRKFHLAVRKTETAVPRFQIFAGSDNFAASRRFDVITPSPSFASKALTSLCALTLAGFLALKNPEAALAVNRPDLLPSSPDAKVIDLADFLTSGQEKKLTSIIENLDKTGYRLRVLCQNYPETPGEAIREYWNLDDRTVVMVADYTFGNVLNFNIGKEVLDKLPRPFWNKLQGDYGNKFMTKDTQGELESSIDDAILKAARRIDNCLRQEDVCL